MRSNSFQKLINENSLDLIAINIWKCSLVAIQLASSFISYKLYFLDNDQLSKPKQR